MVATPKPQGDPRAQAMQQGMEFALRHKRQEHVLQSLLLLARAAAWISVARILWLAPDLIRTLAP